VFTNLFGGGNGNEGLGMFSLCLDFQYIGSNALYLPLTVRTHECLYRISFDAMREEKVINNLVDPI
jgi:hypothetical protein